MKNYQNWNNLLNESIEKNLKNEVEALFTGLNSVESPLKLIVEIEDENLFKQLIEIIDISGLVYSSLVVFRTAEYCR